jgi:hypothetical protein
MYLFVHIGYKYNGYKLDPVVKRMLPLQEFHDLYKSDDLQAYIDASIILFYENNFDSVMENPEQVSEEEAIRRGFERCGKCW